MGLEEANSIIPLNTFGNNIVKNTGSKRIVACPLPISSYPLQTKLYTSMLSWIIFLLGNRFYKTSDL